MGTIKHHRKNTRSCPLFQLSPNEARLFAIPTYMKSDQRIDVAMTKYYPLSIISSRSIETKQHTWFFGNATSESFHLTFQTARKTIICNCVWICFFAFFSPSETSWYHHHISSNPDSLSWLQQFVHLSSFGHQPVWNICSGHVIQSFGLWSAIHFSALFHAFVRDFFVVNESSKFV